MAVAEILTTKRECFTVFEDGRIHMTEGKFTPSKPPIYDVYSKPERPEPGPIDLVEHNIWGQEIYRENTEIRSWRIECGRIDRKNEEEHKKQIKEFKCHLIDIRRRYYKQEAQRQKREAQRKKEFAARQQRGARAYIERAYIR